MITSWTTTRFSPDRYHLQSPIAGSRSTFVATRDGRSYVIKTATTRRLSRARAIVAELFRCEAPDDPRVCGLSEIGVASSTIFLVAPHLDGYNLHYILKVLGENRESLRSEQHIQVIPWIIAQFARAASSRTSLSYNESLLDDDGLAPEELFVTFGGSVAMLDPRWTGLRRLTRVAQTRPIAHMAAYAMPASWRREDLQQRKVTFTLGVLLWELLVGYRLFRRETLAQTLYQLNKADVPSAHRLNPAVPLPLAEFISALLTAPEPLALSQFWQELERFSAQSELSAACAVRAWLSNLFPLALVEEGKDALENLESFLRSEGMKWRSDEESTTFTAAPPRV